MLVVFARTQEVLTARTVRGLTYDMSHFTNKNFARSESRLLNNRFRTIRESASISRLNL